MYGHVPGRPASPLVKDAAIEVCGETLFLARHVVGLTSVKPKSLANVEVQAGCIGWWPSISAI